MPETIRQALASAEQLADVSDSAQLDVQLLLMHVLACDRAHLYAWPDKSLTTDQQTQFNQLLQRRLMGEPIAHIVGQREFWSLPLKTSPATLIPRPETELLVKIALEFLPADKPQRIVDLGTGTGAIALALATERPNWELIACDKFTDAVELAETNRQMLGLENVQVQQSDWCEQLQGQFDLIVSNPPYIDKNDEHLTQGDVRFEPRTALVAKEQGLADIQQIAQQSREHLNAGGWLVLEHGYDQAKQVQQILEQNGFGNIQIRKDLAGNDRATIGKIKR